MFQWWSETIDADDRNIFPYRKSTFKANLVYDPINVTTTVVYRDITTIG